MSHEAFLEIKFNLFIYSSIQTIFNSHILDKRHFNPSAPTTSSPGVIHVDLGDENPLQHILGQLQGLLSVSRTRAVPGNTDPPPPAPLNAMEQRRDAGLLPNRWALEHIAASESSRPVDSPHVSCSFLPFIRSFVITRCLCSQIRRLDGKLRTFIFTLWAHQLQSVFWLQCFSWNVIGMPFFLLLIHLSIIFLINEFIIWWLSQIALVQAVFQNT